ncbi:DUF1656 domain-containing protein [Ancylobacter defluvii]|uniref:DUF1656 domain-containing protein n=1 Tax=Ancylobacter defluvii TaxID=1282440 RepID=A0A9W6K159_9HYPH|nr:DUF1656 domain-containing protein [Ancylobacter defluvii]MBS7586314.1 DUF1656 domain-containing protein [Ancylobacter defluvii]GLK85594.1 hypothetical protein GCM10017653_36640 [Ancylobacter defluvii]
MQTTSSLSLYTPELFGFYLPPVLMWALIALAPFLIIRWLLARIGFYRLVWHRPLFEAALYVILFGAVILGLPVVFGGAGWL